MITPCPFCGAVISPCTCEQEYLESVETDVLKAELERRDPGQ